MRLRWLLGLTVVGIALAAPGGCTVDRVFAPPGGGGATGGGGHGGGGGAQTCTQGSECPTGICADGFCCNKHCSACEACNVPTQEGTCTSNCKDGFACKPSGCVTSCSSPSDCAPNFECKNRKCERVPESDCLDGVDNNGDGLADCADPTCIGSVTECVAT